MPEPTYIGTGSGVEIAVAVFAIFYYLFVLITAIWGYGMLTVDCKNGDMRLALRGLMVLGAIGLTAFIGYIICHVKCQRHVKDISIIGHIPTWLIVFVFTSSVIVMSFQIMVQKALASGDPKDKLCQNSDYYRQFNVAGIVGSVIVIILLFLAIFYRARQTAGKIGAERGKKLTEARKETELVAMKEKEKIEATKRATEEKEIAEINRQAKEKEDVIAAKNKRKIAELRLKRVKEAEENPDAPVRSSLLDAPQPFFGRNLQM